MNEERTQRMTVTNLYWIEEEKRIFKPEENQRYSYSFIESLKNRPVYDIDAEFSKRKHFKTGKFTEYDDDHGVIKTWVHIPYKDLPDEFKTQLLLLGYLNE